MNLIKYTALPTWLALKAIQRLLPKTHPWHNRKFTLDEWTYGRTLICKLFDLNFWLIPVILAEAAWLHFFK